MTRRWTLRLAGCFLAGAAVLTGCSEKQEAAQTLPSPSSAAPTEDELPPLGPADLPMPPGARTQDAAGAEAFVRYYFELLNRSLADMDTTYLRQFAGSGCDVCERIASETESDVAQGYAYEGGELTIVDDVFVKMTGDNEAQSGFVAEQAPMTVNGADGSPVPGLQFDGKETLPSGTIATWDPSVDSWILTELTLG